jgi:hypothetical protein
VRPRDARRRDVGGLLDRVVYVRVTSAMADAVNVRGGAGWVRELIRKAIETEEENQ